MTNLIMRLFVRDWKNTEDSVVREKCGRVAGFVGVVTNLMLFAAKIIVGTLFGSVSITADAVNNLTDSGSSIVTMVGFKLASKPADEHHPFGHARIEYLSGVIVSFIVLFLGWELSMSSIQKIITPEENRITTAALIVLVLSIAMKLWQSVFYRKVGKMIHSDAVAVTAKDSRNDAIATTAVLIGAMISLFTGVNLDGWLGVVVAIFIIVSGVQLILDTANPLLGVAPEKELVQSIHSKILSYEGVIGVHDLAVHNYGVGRCFASVHCEVDAARDLMESHDLIDNIERDFKTDLSISLVIHLDPVEINDPRTNALKAEVEVICAELYPEASIHDFRVVWGVTHSNLVFDMMVPFSLRVSDEVICRQVEEEVCRLNSTYRVVITIDRG